MSLVIDALNDTALGERVMCGLLTHTVTIEEQHEEWVKLAPTPSDQDRFVVIAKGWLSRDPLGFARMLKQVALSPECRAIKVHAKGLLDAATKDAQTEIDQIHIDDFESMVFRASKLEGLWEPDMLFRIFGIFHRNAVKLRAYKDIELQKLAARLRLVSDIPTHSPTATPPSTRKVQRKEMYDEGSYINRLRLPIEVGDIFAKTDAQSEKYYIVLGQPCDLMVRSDGKRTPEINDIILAEVFTSAEKKANSIELKHFSDDPSKAFYVRLRPTHSVHSCVLDLCAYNDDGEARIDVDNDCCDNVLPAWAARFEYLKTFALTVIKRYESFGEGKIQDKQALNYLKSESPKRFPIVTSNSSLFKGTISLEAGKRRLAFNCKRIMRLHRPHAVAVTLELSQYLARPAFERDLAL